MTCPLWTTRWHTRPFLPSPSGSENTQERDSCPQGRAPGSSSSERGIPPQLPSTAPGARLRPVALGPLCTVRTEDGEGRWNPDSEPDLSDCTFSTSSPKPHCREMRGVAGSLHGLPPRLLLLVVFLDLPLSYFLCDLKVVS